MDFAKALEAIKAGKKVRRRGWENKSAYISAATNVEVGSFRETVLAEDWDIVPEIKIVTVWTNVYQEENMLCVHGSYDTELEGTRRAISGKKFLGTYPIKVEVVI